MAAMTNVVPWHSIQEAGRVGCCVLVDGRVNDVAHTWTHVSQITADSTYNLALVHCDGYVSFYLITTAPQWAGVGPINKNIMAMLSTPRRNCRSNNIYGDVMIIKAINGFIHTVTFDEILSTLISGLELSSDSEASDDEPEERGYDSC